MAAEAKQVLTIENDPYRQRLVRRQKELGLSDNEISVKVANGTNPSFWKRFIVYGTPEDLKEPQIRRLAQIFEWRPYMLFRDYDEASDLAAHGRGGNSVDSGDGELVDVSAVPSPLGDCLLAFAKEAPRFEVWRVTARWLRGERIHEGDYLVVDLHRRPYNGNAALGVVRGTPEQYLLRKWRPPAFVTASGDESDWLDPITEEAGRVEVLGTVIAMARGLT